MNKKGFTLIEIIVSIIIIALLLVITAPIITNTTHEIKVKNYESLKNTIIETTINYITTSTVSKYSLDTIKPEGNKCETETCKVEYILGEDIIDTNIYITNTKNSSGKLTVYNPVTGEEMRNSKIIICYDTNTYSLKGVFEEDNEAKGIC